MEHIIEFEAGRNRTLFFDGVGLKFKEPLEICIEQNTLQVYGWLNLDQVKQLHEYLGQQIALASKSEPLNN